MSAVGDAVDRLLAALSAGGVPNTADPDLVAPLIAAHGVVAFVQPPQVTERVLARGMRLQTDVQLFCAPPGNLAQMRAVWDVLGPAMDAAAARETTPVIEAVGGVTYPGYLFTATQRTPC